MKAKNMLIPLLLGSLTATQGKATPAANNPYFLENRGQITDQHGNSRNDIQFTVASPALNLFIGDGQLHYQWSRQTDSLRTAIYRMDVTLLGADAQATGTTEQPQEYHERYYNRQQNGSVAHSYRKITYHNVYPHIDWVLYINGGNVEYDFIVHPGGKVSDIRLQYGGATHLAIVNGQLSATTPMGTITEAKPISHDATGTAVATAFRLEGRVITFEAAAYSGTLTIDPTLSWSTYYGGSGTETVRSGCVTGDNTGNTYLGGSTNSTASIATTGSYQDTLTTGGTDAFLVKFNSAGTRLWATYYGGSGSESSYGISCDPAGNIYQSGYTGSNTDIATPGAYQTVLSTDGQDAFLVKFNASGARQWGTYFGGDATDQGLAVGCDATGNVYLGGYTLSLTGIASTGAFQTVQGGSQDAFLAKFNSAGTRLWSTYFGGSAADQGLAISCDPSRNVYLSGYTQSTSGIATSGAYQTTAGGSKDAYVVKFDSTGNEQWSTYYGGTGQENGYSLACDETGSVYLAGSAASTTGIATTGGFQTTYGGGSADGMLAKFNGSGSLLWATYYGGTLADVAYGLSYRNGKLYMAGYSTSTSGIAVAGTFQDTATGMGDAILVKFDTAGSRIWATYYGGEGSDFGYGVYCHSTSRISMGGQTASYSLLTTTGAVQPTNGGGTYDGFVAVFDDCTLTAPAAITGPDTVCRGTAYTYTTPAVPGASSYAWTLPGGWTGSSTDTSISVTAGTLSDTIRVAANFACGTSATYKKPVYVSPLPVLSPSGPISLCAGNTATLTSTTGTAYVWLLGGIPVTGASGPTHAVTTSGTYAVITTATTGCADTSAAVTVTVHPLPTPVITLSGGVLSTTTYASYQWSHDGTDITGATAQNYTLVTTAGTYVVTVTDAYGCTGSSAPFAPTVGVGTLTAGQGIHIYPNPATDRLSVASAYPVNITITSADGRMTSRYTGATAIDISALAAGVYILQATDGSGALLATERLVIAHK